MAFYHLMGYDADGTAGVHAAASSTTAHLSREGMHLIFNSSSDTVLTWAKQKSEAPFK